MNYELAVKNIRFELKTYVENAGLKSLVLGISGGIDSTLCALLAKPVCDELNIPLIGRSLPATTNTSGENSRASKVGGYFCTEFKETNIQPACNKMFDVIDVNYKVYPYPDETKQNILAGNVKARVRMILLYELAGAYNGMVLSTDNYSELMLGFWTLHGDVGDYGMIQNIWKTEVYEMAEWIAYNEGLTPKEMDVVISVLEADATDGLGISKTDLDQILPGWEGSSRDGYKEVDRILKNFNDEHDSPVTRRKVRTQFKRDNPVNIPYAKIVGIPDNIVNK